ncbi:hypothetical protein TWF506_006238 [Arthrobotrys conoides]|uniref:3'-5' exonuclease domain-containing protein n=1 Tax=Arthrobotrys conoides TaxID=74498 RepID=A0AAN8NGY4_9PEZI
MSRRLPSFQVRAATTSIGRPTTRCCFHSFIMEEQTIVSGSSNSGGGSGGAAATGAANTTNTPTKLAPPLTTAYQPSATSSPSPFSNNGSSPITPVTPTNAHRLWNPSRGIIFAPSPMTPVSPFASSSSATTTPLSRGFKTMGSSKSSLDTPNKSTNSSSDMLESPTVRRVVQPKKRSFRGQDWAGLMNLTADGKEKETVPAGFDTFQDDLLADSTGGPLSDVKALQDAIGALAEEIEADTTAPPEETEGEEFEDPGIERVRTPEGIEIIKWKGKPIVYTEEKDPYVKLLYQASEDVITAAVEANGNFDMNHYINSEGTAPTIHYVTDVDDMEEVSKLFENDRAIGFDMEWVPNAVLKPTVSDREIRICTSVIQVANQERVAIFHLAKFPATTKRFLAPTLKKILEDPGILKMGVSIKGDMTRLSTLINVNPAGVLELSSFHSLVFAAEGNVPGPGKSLPASLTNLCKEHLKLPLNKGDVRTSNWSRALDDAQKFYAANDAYASYRIYEAIEERRCALDPRPALPPLHTVNHEETVEAYHKRKAAAAKNEGTPKKPSVIRVPKDAGPKLVRAYDWVKEYAKSKPDGILSTGAANLRCYALWHHQTLDVEDTAAACRDPPLGSAYVAQCILEAILVEKLPYHPGRLMWVMRDLSKEALGRFYPLKVEANIKIKEHKEQELAAEAAAKDAAIAAAKAKSEAPRARASREQIGRGTYDGGKQTALGDHTGWNMGSDEPWKQRPRSRSRSLADPEPLAGKFGGKATRTDGPPKVRYHVAVDSTPRPFVRKVGSESPTHDESPGSTNTPMQRSYSSPPKPKYRRLTLNSTGSGDGPTVSFHASGELGDVVNGFGGDGVREVAEDMDGEEATSLRESKSEPNLAPKRPVWIGVPSRRRKNDL